MYKDISSYKLESNKQKKILIVEQNDCHGEILPGYSRYFFDLGFNIDLFVTQNQTTWHPMSRYTKSGINIYVVDHANLQSILNSEVICRYDFILFTSFHSYTSKKGEYFPITKLFQQKYKPKYGVLAVVHHTEHVDSDTCGDIKIITINCVDNNLKLKTTVVNPHYFGDIQITNKNLDITKFIVVGNFEKERRNHALLVDAVKNLISSNITNFHVSLIGRQGNFQIQDEEVKKHITIHEKVPYETIFSELESADFFIPLLDPENDEHNRYIQNDSSASFQKIYGFCKPCIIAKKFTGKYCLDDANSIIYDSASDLFHAMQSAINMSSYAYTVMQNNLMRLSDQIYKSSLDNLKNVLASLGDNNTDNKIDILTFESRLNRLEKIRTSVTWINPEAVAVVTLAEVLEEAIVYYAAFDPPLSRMPDFVVIDGDDASCQKWQDVAIKHGVKAVPYSALSLLSQTDLCVYARPMRGYWDKGGFILLDAELRSRGHEKYLVDAAGIAAIWQGSANPDYVQQRLHDIFFVYSHLGDEESKENYLRAIKAMQTGDSGYLKVSSYQQYFHPKVCPQRGDVVIEGGVFDGSTTKAIAQCVAPVGRVYGFEPLREFVQKSKNTCIDCDNVVVEALRLWSGPNTFYFENMQGGSRMVTSPNDNTEECHSVDIDSYISQKCECCDLIKLDIEGAEVECLKGAMHTIRHYSPKLQISLYHELAHYIDIPLALMREDLNYSFFIGQHNPYFYETVLYAMPHRDKNVQMQHLEATSLHSNLVSIVVPVHNAERTLERCFDSILLQKVAKFEIIVVDEASTDNSPEIILRYAKRYPALFRTMRFSKYKKTGIARNAGMDMAQGEFITFVNASDMLAEDFLSNAMPVMREEQADIVACDKILISGHKGESSYLGQVQPGVLAGENSLEHFLLYKAGCYGPQGKLYSHNFLRKYHITYADTLVHDDIFFGIKAFYHSKKTIVSPLVAYYQHERVCSLSDAKASLGFLQSFSQLACFLTSFYTTHGLDIESAGYKYCLHTVYGWDKKCICRFINELDRQNTLDSGVFRKILREIGTCKEVLSLFLADCALHYCDSHGLKPMANANIVHWKKEALQDLPAETYAAYGHAEAACDTVPAISVIIPNYNKEKYVLRCLNSILNQTFQNFEIIIVDDSSTDTSYALLQDYADKFSRIRLYRMDYNCKQGVCRNVGIDKARAPYVIFVDSDDVCEADFFSKAYAYIEEKQPDIIFFKSCCYPDNLWNTVWKNMLCSAQEIEKLFWDDFFDPSPWAKVFKKSMLNEHALRFPSKIFQQDQPFVLAAIRKSTLCICDSYCAYIMHATKDSAIRPQSYGYLHLHSCCKFLDFLDTAWLATPSREMPNNQHFSSVTWHLKNIFFPSVCAAYRALGHIPMTEMDYALLQKNMSFLHVLLREFSKIVVEGALPQNAGVPLPQRLAQAQFKQIVNKPLLSVIIPVYNQETRLIRCLDSVLSQSLRSIEVLLVNDSSYDATPQLCEAYARRDSRVRVLHNDINCGQGYSRNRALQLAEGDFIAFIDSDDTVLENFFLHGVSFLTTHKHDFISFNFINKSEDDSRVDYVTMPEGTIKNPELFVEYCHSRIRSWTPWSKIFRASFIKKYKLTFPHYLCEDPLFMIKAYYFARKVYFSCKYGYVYYSAFHEHSAMHPNYVTKKHISGLLNLVADTTAFVSSLPIENSKVLLANRLPAFFDHYRTFLPTIAKNAKGMIAFSDVDIINISNSSEFLKILLEDYATLYAQHTNYKALLPYEDRDPCAIQIPPADYLNSITYHARTNANVLISVIVPAFNAEHCLEKCLNSILDQHIDDLEIILVEDSSTKDETLTLCKHYAQKYPCIRLYSTPWNSTQGPVRNLALKEVRGKFVTFVDSDDWLEPFFLQRAYVTFDEFPHVEMVVCNVNQWYATHNDPSTCPDAIISGKEMVSKYIKSKFKHWGVWGILYRTEFLVDNNISFSHNYYEDEIFLIKAYILSDFVCLRSFVGYNYCRHSVEESTMRSSLRGKKYFSSSLYNLKYYHDELSTHVGFGEDSEDYFIKLNNFRWKHHCENILHYIHACKNSGLPSPLTDDVLKTLCCSRVFLSGLLVDHAVLRTQMQHPKPHSGQQAQQKKISHSSPQGISHPSPHMWGAICHFSLDKGSLLERALWLVSSNRACIHALRRSGMFDVDYYRAKNPDVAQAGVDPIYHYVHFGAAEGRDPAPWFSTRGYLRRHKDVAAAGVNAFYHCLRYGRKEGRGTGVNDVSTPHSVGKTLGMGSLFERVLWHVAPKRACIKALRRSGMFDADYYRAENPDVAQAGVDPVYHYVHFGAAEGRDPAPWFSTRGYLQRYEDVAVAGSNAFYHYLRYGREEGRNPRHKG